VSRRRLNSVTVGQMEFLTGTGAATGVPSAWTIAQLGIVYAPARLYLWLGLAITSILLYALRGVRALVACPDPGVSGLVPAAPEPTQ